MVTIRKAGDADKPGIWQIIKAVLAGGDTYVFEPDTPESDMLAYWFSPEKHVYVAVSEPPGSAGGQFEEVLGTFWLKSNQPGLGDHVCNAAYMVSPDAQGQGVGKLMAEFSLDEARRLGFKAMQFNFVVASNTAAIRLWQSIGMEIIGTIPDAFRHNSLGMTDALIMFRKL